MLAPLFAALALGGGAPQASGPLLNADGLRRLEVSMRKEPAEFHAAHFQFDLPFVSDRKTNLGALQNPAGWTYDNKTGVLTLTIDFGAVTPENYRAFDKQDLFKAPPLRTFYFDTRATRDKTYHQLADDHGNISRENSWRVVSESYGLAIPTSAKDYGVRGGDLPDAFTLPVLMQVKVAPRLVEGFVRTLRVRMEGDLRTLNGAALLCGDSTGDGYVVDEFTQKTPNIIVDAQCLAPAVLTRVSLIRDNGQPLKTWTRASAEPMETTAATAVIVAGGRQRFTPPIVTDSVASSPAATAPLPTRH